MLAKALLTAGLAVGLALSTATGAQAAPSEPAARPAGEAGVLGGCDWTGCGTVVNSTPRGFWVTLNWGPPQSDFRWLSAWSRMGGNGTDVDGIEVANGCVMSGVINGRIPGYNYPFVWTSGWHKIWTNETAFVTGYVC
ncbi:hypothetical protein [Actinokineospora sp. HUAS TT18]|uniref:hypothetical protein n=1 Tax=Actinokineospora sp. HUAS TT18 TaxID=3447451 RepID=UPI003F51C276